MITELLLVDDHDRFRRLLFDMLSKELDMKVIGEANDGVSAIRMASKLKPHVVLMDVVMPGEGGIEATNKILSANPQIKVIAISMHAEDAFVNAMFNTGATGYVLKDRATRELVEAIRVVVVGGSFRSSGLS